MVTCEPALPALHAASIRHASTSSATPRRVLSLPMCEHLPERSTAPVAPHAARIHPSRSRQALRHACAPQAVTAGHGLYLTRAIRDYMAYAVHRPTTLCRTRKRRGI